MPENQERIKKLSENLDILAKRQEAFGEAIRQLKEEIYLLRHSETAEEITANSKREGYEDNRRPEPATKNVLQKVLDRTTHFSKVKSNIEKFIGENLINKIGILILIIGVGIGSKYAIDNELVSPLTRVVLGYLVGLGLLGFAFRLKSGYKNFSAVLLSGAIAVLYFMTYAAYSFYALIPQEFTFALMALLTAFTVVAALNYDKQIIALIGLVGAYAVPFLLSSGSGQILVLFSYMAIINIGILIIAIKKYWRLLYYTAFLTTWLIFGSWLWLDGYRMHEHFSLALLFLSVFFVIFYITFLANKLINKEKFGLADILLLIANSFLFFGIGLAMLKDHDTGQQLMGVFTIINAVLHFIVSYVIYRQKLVDQNFQYLISGLVLVFITIAIPIQLDGNWVTLLWAGEAALLFWIGRTNNVLIYEKLSYPLMILAFISLLEDWANGYNQYYMLDSQKLTPLLNEYFLTSVIFIALFAFINLLNRQERDDPANYSSGKLTRLFSYLIPGILLLTLYYAFRVEIENYWHQLHLASKVTTTSERGAFVDYYMNDDLKIFQSVWVINYSLLFLAMLSYVNIRRFKNAQLGVINLLINVIVIAVFLVQGLYLLSELRESYIAQDLAQYYDISRFNINIRYLSFVFLGTLLLTCYQYTRQAFMKRDFRKYFDLLLHLSILWIISSELIHWLHLMGSAENYKLGLSILWGTYSLLLIVLGFWKKKKYWRMGAIVLFGITLIKLFLYDISHLNTISKTIVFVSLGILLLIISFLYNKYTISDEED